MAESFNLTHSATATGSTAPYHNIAIDPVAITTTDAGHGVVVSESTLSVAENDETATYTVVLKSQPSGNVQITTTSGATGTATVSPATLTFTNSNWNTPKTVTVTGKGAGSTSISHAVATSADTTNYPTTTTIPSVTVTVTAVAAQVLDLSWTISRNSENIGGNLIITATGGSGALTVTGGTSLLTFSGEGITPSDYSHSALPVFVMGGGPPPYTNVAISFSDNVDEPNEVITVGLQNLPSGYRAGTTASFTIVDINNPTTVTLAGGGTVAEDGSDSADVTVTLSRNLVAGETVTVPLAITGAGIAAGDYTIVRAPGSSLNSGVTLNTSNPHSAAQPAVVFTGHDTNTVQVATLRVTAVQDTTDEGASEALTVGFGSGSRAVISNLDLVDPSATGPGGTTTAGTATVTITDDDEAPGVTISPTSLALTELGDASTIEKSYTVVLNTDPTANVTVTVANGDATAVAVDTNAGTNGDQSTLTFTAGGDGSGSGAGNGNWATAQTVTVRALNDADALAESFNLTHSATATGSTAPYHNIAIDPVAITTTDAGHGVVVSESTLSVAENDETATYTVALKSQPSGNVQITTTSGATGTATVSPATLTFGSSTWNSPQTVTVTGKGAGSTSISHAVATSADTTNYPTTTTIPSVSVTVTAVAAQVLDLSFRDPDLQVNEGQVATLDITATGGSGTLVVTGGTSLLTFSGEGITSSDYSLATGSNFVLLGGPPPFAAYTMDVSDDNVDEPNERMTVGLQNLPSGYSAGTTASILIFDQDPTTVTLAGGGTVAEDGTDSADVTVTLSRNLVAGEEVTVPLAISGTGIAGSDYTIMLTPGAGNNTGVTLNTSNPHSAAQPAVVFTGHGTNTVQVATLRVTAVQDNRDEGASEALSVGFGSGNRAVTSNLDRSSGTGTGGTTTAGTATVTITDDDGAGFAISETNDDTTVSEASGAGNTDTYTVRLATEPAASVEITVTSGDTAAATVSPSTLTFTTSNWSTLQTVTVTGVDDNVDQTGNRSATISHSATSTDARYNNISIANVTATVVDNDTAAVNVNDSGGVSVTEASGAGRTDTYTVALATRPTHGVTITPTSATPAAATVSPATLTFTTSNWSAPQTVTVTGVDDNVDQTGNRSVTISHSATSTDANYNNINIANVTATVVDNDGAGVTINESDGTSVSEASGAGNTDTYTVVLDTQPTHGVTITPTSSNTAAATVSGTLTFTTSNWNTPQPVTLTGVDDNTDNPGGGREVSISHGASSTDPSYTISSAGSVEATVSDDDATTVTLSGAGSNMEEGESQTFTITLGRGLVDGETLTAPLAFGGTATRGTDYTMTGTVADGVQYNNLNSGGATVVFTGPQSGATATTATITLSATADSTTESTAETVEIGLGSITNTGLTGAGGVTPTDSLEVFTISDATTSDMTAPRVTSIVRRSPSSSPTDADSLTWRVTFNEAVQNVDRGDFSITGATATLAVAQVGATNAYDVTASGGNLANLDDTVTLRFANGQNIQDTSGNRLSNTNPTGANHNDFVVDNSDDDGGGDGDDGGDDGDGGDGGGDGPSSVPTVPVVQFSTTAYTGGESQGSRTVNLELSAQPPFSTATTVSYQVGGSATPGEDFTALAGTVSMSGSRATIPVSVLDDQMAEGDETIIITLTAADGYTVGTQGSITVTITDDDGMSPPSLPVVSITAGETISEGEPATFTLTATPAPAQGNPVTVNLMLSARGEVISSEEIGSRSVTINDSGTATVTVSTEDDAVQEEDGSVTATVQDGTGYAIHPSDFSASVTVRDNEVARLSVPSLTVAAGESASYTVTLADQPMGAVTVTITPERVASLGRSASNTVGNAMGLVVTPDRLLFTSSNWDDPQEVVVRVTEDAHGASLVLRHIVRGDGLDGRGDTHLPVTVDAATETVDTATETVDASTDAAEGMEAWRLRFGRTLSHQVVDALQDRFAAPPTTGLNLTVAGEAVSSPPALAENDRVLSKALGFENVSPQLLAEGSSFSFSPQGEAGAPRLALWGQGALSSFSGQEEEVSLDGDVTTLLVGADWSTGRWQAGAALSRSWGNGSYDGNDDADGEISTTLTGLFPYGRYVLSPRLGLWATAGYGWGNLSLKPDGNGEEYEPDTTMTMVALGMDGLLLDGGSEGVSLNATADLLSLSTTSEKVEGLESSEGKVSRLRLGLEATRPFPLANGSSLLPSMEVGIRQDGGDAETGFGMDLGAGITWKDPQRGISAELKGRTLLSHAEEEFQDQGLALSFSWDPSPSNRGPYLSMGHAMGATATADMDALFNPATFEQMDGNASNGQQFAAELAYGFPVHNDRLTLTPAVAMALSPTSRNYGLLWSLAPYTEQLETDPWQFSIEAERQEHTSPSTPTDHSLKLTFSTLL